MSNEEARQEVRWKEKKVEINGLVASANRWVVRAGLSVFTQIIQHAIITHE
jgi:hypothetical protein